jgi:DegV family protein with EDD domain
LSGTYNSAETAKNQLDSDKIALVDSKNVATGQTLIVIEAARMVQQGKSMTEIVARLDPLIDGMRLNFVLNTLEYLVKGGRVSSAAGLFGTLLQMKPILHVREGRVEPLERIRTRNKAMARLREIVDAAVRDKNGVRIGVVHTGLPVEAEALSQEFRAKYGLDECMVVEMPPAVAAHAGPGALGAAYYVET